MKSRIVALAAGLLIGGAVLGGPLVATADENRTLEVRVGTLEHKFDKLCVYFKVYKPNVFTQARELGVC